MTQPWLSEKQSDISAKLSSTLPAVGGSRWLNCIMPSANSGQADSMASARLACALATGLALAAACWRAARRRRRRAALHPPLRDPSNGAPLSKACVFKLRRALFCGAQSVSYANSDPLLAMRGSGHHLYDEEGRAFLDTRNNVCHVGHANAAVAEAVCLQVRVLNTNSRYLHPTVCLLARQLLATLPAPLCDGVVFFVNSGSEANDLALRLARAHTGRHGVVVVERGYHGHTVGTLAISPYKAGSPRAHAAERQPAWVRAVPAPDVYRGPYRGPDAAQRYAAHVGEACAALAQAAAESGDPSLAAGAFFAESGMSVAGVLVPPRGYLPACYAAVRAAGGVCIADEVQTGLGRCGNGGWWAFEGLGDETHGAPAEARAGAGARRGERCVPDMVTVGKPLGNGMPIGAVLCSRELAVSFAAGPEYFNTFGGNPVCAAAALAVLQQIEALGLRGRARETGAALRAGLLSLAAQPHGALIGQVRGGGLFWGIDLVTDRQARTPASAQASWVCSRLKRTHRVLTSLDGPSDNVLVVKPPLTFGRAEAAALVAALDECLRALARLPPGELEAGGLVTPT